MKNNKINFLFSIIFSNLALDFVFFIANLYILDETKSGISLATNIVLKFIPVILLSSFFGNMADKFPKRFLIVCVDSISYILYFLFAFSFTYLRVNIYYFYALTLLISINYNFVYVCFQSGKPELFEGSILNKMNSYTVIASSTVAIISPILAGLSYKYMSIRNIFIIIDILTLISIIFEFNLNFIRKSKTVQNIKYSFKNILYNINYLKDYLFSFMFMSFIVSLIIYTFIPYILRITLEVSDGIYSISQAILPIGMILGSIVIDKYNIKMSFKNIKYIFLIIIILSIIMFVAIIVKTRYISIILFLISVVVLGIIGSASDILLFTYLQETIEERYLGKFIGTTISTTRIIAMISVILSGYMLSYISLKMNIIIIIGISLIIYFILFKILNKHKIIDNN